MGSVARWAGKAYAFNAKHIGWVLVALISIIGITLFVWGKYKLSLLSVEKTDPWADISAGLGTLLCASGVSGAVLKLIATEGFFKDAMAELLHGETAMSRLSEEALVEAWGHATRLLYLKNMSAVDVSDRTKAAVSDIRVEVSKAIKEQFPSSVQFFTNRSVRHITLRWRDKEKGILDVEDIVDFTVIPFNHKEPLVINTKVKAWANCDMEDYSIVDSVIRLTNGKEDDLTCVQTVSSDKKERSYRYTSKPREQHAIHKHTNCIIPIYKDPNWHAISTFIIRDMDVYITNNADDLTVVFNTLGDDSLFHFTSGGEITNFKEILHFTLSEGKTILPGMGYGFTFVKTS